MKPPRLTIFLAALSLGLGLAICGLFIGPRGIAMRGGRRLVTVKGLSEKEVPASIAIWNINYITSGNTLDDINKKLGDSTKAVVAFLKGQGFDDKEIAVQPPSVHDTSTDTHEKEGTPPPDRYTASQSVLLRTSKIDAVKPALANASSLMSSGVLLSGGANPTYIFNQLNDIKPGMIEEATKNARVAAARFAEDSQTKLGELHSASQGWFEVEDRDAATPERKIVRVVVDVEYELN